MTLVTSLLALFVVTSPCSSNLLNAVQRPPAPAIVHLGYPNFRNVLPQHQTAVLPPALPRVVYQPIVVQATQHSYEVVEQQAAEVPPNQATRIEPQLVPSNPQPLQDTRIKDETPIQQYRVEDVKPYVRKSAKHKLRTEQNGNPRSQKFTRVSDKVVQDVKPSGQETDLVKADEFYKIPSTYEPFIKGKWNHESHTPLKKVTKWGGKGHGDKDGGKEYHAAGGEKSHKQSGKYDKEASKKGKSGKESSKKSYADHKGHKHEFHDEGGYGGSHHKAGSGGGSSNHKHGGHRDKGAFSKGFHDIHHKDEHKKSDSVWKNHHEEGNWHEYGSKNDKYGKKGSHKKAQKHNKEGNEEKSYKKEEREGKS